MEFLKVEDLCKVYGKGENKVTALDHVSLTIEKGEFTAIIGSSGSGKVHFASYYRRRGRAYQRKGVSERTGCICRKQ